MSMHFYICLYICIFVIKNDSFTFYRYFFIRVVDGAVCMLSAWLTVNSAVLPS